MQSKKKSVVKHKEGEKRNCDSCNEKYPIEFPTCPKCYLEIKDDIKEIDQKILIKKKKVDRESTDLYELKKEYVETIRRKYKVMYRVTVKFGSSSSNIYYYFDNNLALSQSKGDKGAQIDICDTKDLGYDILSTPGTNCGYISW